MNFLSLVQWTTGAIDQTTAALAAWAYAQMGILYYDESAGDATDKQNAGILHTAIQDIITFLDQIWNHYLKGLLSKIWDLLCKIQDYLRRILSPLLCIIKWLHCWQQYIFNQIIKPAIDLIQRLRYALVLFRILGFKWATALDNYIVAQEMKLISAFLATWRNLNILASWIDFILNPVGLFGPVPFLRSIAAAIGAIINIGANAMIDPGYTAPAVGWSPPAGYLTASAEAPRLAQLAAGIPLPEFTLIASDLRAAAAELGWVR